MPEKTKWEKFKSWIKSNFIAIIIISVAVIVPIAGIVTVNYVSDAREEKRYDEADHNPPSLRYVEEECEGRLMTGSIVIDGLIYREEGYALYTGYLMESKRIYHVSYTLEKVNMEFLFEHYSWKFFSLIDVTDWSDGEWPIGSNGYELIPVPVYEGGWTHN